MGGFSIQQLLADKTKFVGNIQSKVWIERSCVSRCIFCSVTMCVLSGGSADDSRLQNSGGTP